MKDELSRIVRVINSVPELVLWLHLLISKAKYVDTTFMGKMCAGIKDIKSYLC